MSVKWKNTFDKDDFFSCHIHGLIKAIDTLNHDLLFSKLGAYAEATTGGVHKKTPVPKSLF